MNDIVRSDRRIAERVSGPSELLQLEHCGHLPHRERRDEVLARVQRFLG